MRKRIKNRQPNKKLIIILISAIIIVLLILLFKFLNINIFNHPQDNTQTQNKYNISNNIYFVKANSLWKITGTNIKQVTSGKNIYQASVSPDGANLVYSNKDGNESDLYLLNLNKNVERKLTNNKSNKLYDNLWAFDPIFSPDGSNLLYITDKSKYKSGIDDLSIYGYSLNTNQTIQYTQGNNYTGGDQDPSYYPLDENYFIYNKYIYDSTLPQPYTQLFMLNTKTKQSYSITPDNSGVIQATFSPDGKYIAYIKRDDPDGKYLNLYIMPFNLNNTDSIDNSGFINDYNNSILINKGLNAMPSFSPDGKSLAFANSINGNFELAVSELTFNKDKKGNITISPSDLHYLTNDFDVSAISRISWTK